MLPVSAAARASSGNSPASVPFRRTSVYVVSAPIVTCSGAISMPRNSGIFQMLRNFLCASLPASSRTIKSVPPAKSFHTPGSRAMRSSTSARSRGAANSYAGRYDLTAAARPRGTLRPRIRKSSCSRCSGRDFRRGPRESRRRSARDGAPADLPPRESFPACRFRTARRRARETPAAPHRDARRARCLRSCESSRPPRATAGHEAAIHERAVDFDRARAALALAASFFRAGEAAVPRAGRRAGAPSDTLRKPRLCH